MWSLFLDKYIYSPEYILIIKRFYSMCLSMFKSHTLNINILGVCKANHTEYIKNIAK